MTSIGDMATNLMLRTRSFELQQTMAQLTDELASGQVSDVHARVGGDYAYLTDIEMRMARLDGYTVATNEASILAAGMQTSLERMHDIALDLSSTLLTTGQSVVGPNLIQGSSQAAADLDDMMNALNGTSGGRTLFSGTSTDTQPLAASEDLLAGLSAAIAGQTTTADIRAAAEAWFDDPAGFEAVVYQGGTTDTAPNQIGEFEQVNLSLRADDQVFRDMMRETALAVLATDPGLALDDAVQVELMQTAGQNLIGVTDSLTATRADLGYAQARIEDAQARHEFTRVSLDQARNELLAADPFDTAVRLEAVQIQLQTLYAVTARNSQLTLVNFIS